MHSGRRNRLIACIAAFAMVVVICGYAAHDFAAHSAQPDQCDLAMHFAGVAGSAPMPMIPAKPVLTAWVVSPHPAVDRPASRRVRAHLARAPPAFL